MSTSNTNTTLMKQTFARHLFLLASLIAVHTATAQDTTAPHVKIVDEHGAGAIGNGGGTARQIAGGASHIQIAPRQLVIDPNSKAATITLTNTGDDTVKAKIAAKDVNTADGGTAHPSVNPSAIAGSLAAWIRDLPSQVTLAPHETRSITVHVTVPEHLTNGDYAGDVVVGSPGGAPAMDNALLAQLMQAAFGGNGGGMRMRPQRNGGSGQPSQIQGAPSSSGSGNGVTCRLVYHASQH